MITIDKTKCREIPRLYVLYRRAFPSGERKPFRIILKMARSGQTDLWSIRTDGRFAGFAATVNAPELVLLDYFAVKRSLRERGIGSEGLKLVERQYRDRGFFVEIESTFEKADNLPQRQKRKTFYVNCGMLPMGTEADVFGVRMELLGVRCHLDFQSYRSFYRDHYSPWAAEHIREVRL